MRRETEKASHPFGLRGLFAFQALLVCDSLELEAVVVDEVTSPCRSDLIRTRNLVHYPEIKSSQTTTRKTELCEAIQPPPIAGRK